ncbi:GAF domain-containing sensor histidine kinase [Nocardioides allogilvus]|uniref:GAF domain-containing sensor histidine kinase n=1 Tax=Nocardioides allogilvus TaxID=2072017 RepID=UPI001E4B7459|nr:ATP-binding protein [Nocardioides allogilvus]
MKPAGDEVPDARQLADLLDAEGVLVYAIDGQDLSIVDMHPTHPSAAALKLQVGFGVTGLVARTRKAVLLEADSPRNALHRQLLGLAPHQTVARMCLPLPGVDGRVIGVLAVHRSPRRPFGDADLAAAESVVSLLGLHVHAEQLFRAASRHRTERDQLIKQAVQAQEAERRRLAFDLHDGVTTALASMSFHLSAADLTVSQLAASDESDLPTRVKELYRARDEISNARALADMAYNQTRAAITGLHSLVLDDLGLVAAIESLVQTARRDDGPEIRLVVDPEAGVDTIPDHAAASLYRIAQEALANAVKHADAEQITLSLRRVGDSMVLGCTDDGLGFDVAETRTSRAGDADGSQHFGLSSVAERCAVIETSLRVESVPGRGTTVLVELPL